MATDFQKELFASLVAEIKEYHGQDPLLPWLRGIGTMKKSLPPRVLQEKLPRFLQKCVETFETDPRYRNDSRYLRIWIQLMDYVDDAKVVLRRMEKNQIGLKRASFYSAYALYYEKRKKFEEAEKMYHLGVQNLAEPVSELQKSYEQFIERLELYKKRKAKGDKFKRGRLTLGSTQYDREGIGGSKGLVDKDDSKTTLTKNGIDDDLKSGEYMRFAEGCMETIKGCEGSTKSLNMTMDGSDFCDHDTCDAKSICHANPIKACDLGSFGAKSFVVKHKNSDMHLKKQSFIRTDDTVVVKFVGSAIVGKSEAEDACHHGLVDPTVNMKEAMNAISNMFREPLETESKTRRRSHQSKPKADQQANAIEVFIDESLEEGENLLDCRTKASNRNCRQTMNSHLSKKQIKTELQKPVVGEFKILADDEESEHSGYMELEKHMKATYSTESLVDSRQISQKSINTTNLDEVGLKEDTIIQRFVGYTIFDESKVENACHHGLVDPTINLKDAINDINSMFGQPLNIIKTNKPKKHRKFLDHEPVSQGFCILADDDLEGPKAHASSGFEHSKMIEPKSKSEVFHIFADDDLAQGAKVRASSNIPGKFSGNDLFEPTVFTKEALEDINDMFGRPLDF